MRTRDPPDRLASGTPDTKSVCHKHVQQAIGLSFWHFARGGIAAGTCRATRPRARRGARRRSASDPPGDRREPVGFPEFAGAGNLWLWIPQVRAGLDIASHGATRLGIEAAALAPTSGDPQTAFLTQPDIAERSSRPFLEGRLRARWGEGDSRGEASIGGHYGWLAVGPDWRVVTRAAAVSVWTSLAAPARAPRRSVRGPSARGLGRWRRWPELRATAPKSCRRRTRELAARACGRRRRGAPPEDPLRRDAIGRRSFSRQPGDRVRILRRVKAAGCSR